MKTYTVLYAVDVPHYGAHEIQAENDDAAIEAAIALHKQGSVTFNDPQWSSSVCARIVQIEDEAGAIIDEDRPIDDYFLRSGGAKARLLCDHAEEMLKMLQEALDCFERISDTLYSEDATPVTVLEAREVEDIYLDSISNIAPIETLIKKVVGGHDQTQNASS